MTKCKICEREFKTLNGNHMKTHGLTMLEYYKQHDHDKYIQESRIEPIASFLYEHYVTVQYRYLEYHEAMPYTKDSRVLKPNGKRDNALYKSKLIAHIRGIYTVGVYFMKYDTKFIGLDLDIMDTEKLELIFNALWSYGIPQESIFMSYSGNKGYHIDIFLNKLIKKTAVYQFYEMLLNEVDLTKKELEVRGAGAQGYKLPLGINLKTGNFCFACNKYGQQIDELEAIKNVQKADIGLIFDALDINYESTKNDKQLIEYEEMTASIPYTSQYENTNRRRKVEKALYNGLRQKGERNNTCFEVAMYCKDVENLCLADTIHRMNEWVNETWSSGAKPKEFLNSGEVEKVAKKVFKHDYKFSSKYDDLIGFTENEIEEVFNVANKHGKKQEGLRKLYHAMIIHAKGYAGTDGIFFMTYEQIRNLGLRNNNERIKNQIDELIGLGKVERFEPEEERMKNGKTPPYKYRLPMFEIIREREKGTQYFTCDTTSRCKDCIYVTYNCLIKDKELPLNSSCHGKLIIL